MNVKLHLRESSRNLFSAKLRSILAILGVLVGTAAVVALIASSRLATNHALAQFKSLGTNLLALNFQSTNMSQGQGSTEALQLNQIPQLVHASSQIVMAAPYIQLFQSMALFGKSFPGQVMGTTGEMRDIAKIRLTQGRFISSLDRNEFYCVIGHKIAAKFRAQHQNPIGQQIQVGKHIFTIVGVVAPWTPNLFLLVDLDNAIIIPLSTSHLLIANANIHNVLFRLIKHPDIPNIQQGISAMMDRILPNQQLQFRDPTKIIKLISSQRQTFNWLLIAIGSIALVVGGIGVMNIMLVSVVERRREIGIRMAVGAQRRDILFMFLIESIVLTLFGGLLGIIVGLTVTYVLAYVTGWTFYFYWSPVLLGFIVSVFVGIASGFYPAWGASKLDPICCLAL